MLCYILAIVHLNAIKIIKLISLFNKNSVSSNGGFISQIGISEELTDGFIFLLGGANAPNHWIENMEWN